MPKPFLFLALFFTFLFFPFYHSLAAGPIIINEIMYDFAGSDDKHEWVEIKNISDSAVDLKNWRFNDGSSNHSLNEPPKNGGQGSLIIPAHNLAILAADAITFLNDNPNFSGIVIDTVMSLKNDSSTLKLIDNNGNVIDEVVYQKEMGGDDNKGFTLARTGDNSFQFCESNNVGGSPGKEDDFNCHKPTVTPSATSSNKNFSSPSVTPTSLMAIISSTNTLASLDISDTAIEDKINKEDDSLTTSNKPTSEPIKVRILINEFIPNPAGSDSENEWVELYNDSDIDLNLKDWFIEDASGKKYVFKDEKINKKDYLVLNSKNTKISLNNNGETLRLYSPNKELAFEISYSGTAKEGLSYARYGTNDWRWTSILTPGAKNQFGNSNNSSQNNLSKDSNLVVEGISEGMNSNDNKDLLEDTSINSSVNDIEASSSNISNNHLNKAIFIAIGLGLILSVAAAIFLKKFLPSVTQNNH